MRGRIHCEYNDVCAEGGFLSIGLVSLGEGGGRGKGRCRQDDACAISRVEIHTQMQRQQCYMLFHVNVCALAQMRMSVY